MLMTKYIFRVMQGQDGYHHSVVTRVQDGAQKYFFQCGGCVEGLTRFFESMPDELLEGYFPKPGKRGGSAVDNWAFLGPNPDRAVVEELARTVDLPLAQMDATHRKLSGQ